MYKWLDPHHRIKRAFDKENTSIIHLCRECHNYVETHPEEARRQGYSFHKYDIDGKDDQERGIGTGVGTTF